MKSGQKAKLAKREVVVLRPKAPKSGKKKASKSRTLRQVGTVRVAVPAAMGSITRRLAPKMYASPKGDGSIRVSHREYIYDLDNTVFIGAGFQVDSRTLLANPAYAGTTHRPMFPWLQTLASRYDKYKVRKMEIVYSPLTGTGTSGKVYIAAVSDVKQGPPTTKADFLQLEHAMSCPVWGEAGKEVRFTVPRDFYTDRRELLFNRSNDTPYPSAAPQDAVDLLNYDFCKFFIAVSGTPTTSFGEIAVDYEIELHQPVLSPEVAGPSSTNLFPNNVQFDTQVVSTGLGSLGVMDIASAISAIAPSVYTGSAMGDGGKLGANVVGGKLVIRWASGVTDLSINPNPYSTPPGSGQSTYRIALQLDSAAAGLFSGAASANPLDFVPLYTSETAVSQIYGEPAFIAVDGRSVEYATAIEVIPQPGYESGTHIYDMEWSVAETSYIDTQLAAVGDGMIVSIFLVFGQNPSGVQAINIPRTISDRLRSKQDLPLQQRIQAAVSKLEFHAPDAEVAQRREAAKRALDARVEQSKKEALEYQKWKESQSGWKVVPGYPVIPVAQLAQSGR